ncbi:MAG: spermidine synthase [Labilithrix sp.]|nr:spermidine synthase [Labilithrix sp.]MCW5814023.1 spermidine synthase [Labilithrix sp.]
MISPLRRVVPFLFFSGACALVYQIAWFRELRLVFGGSTAASGAVLAAFMGGLGVGGIMLGRRADRSPNPFAFYANLELFIAVTAGLSPLLVVLARAVYLGIGGAATLGTVGATALRLVLTALVLGPSTIAMGGTMPAAARAVERWDDVGRSRVGLLYGVNTIGAVAGTLLANFLAIELFGTRMTLWLACLVNALVGVIARSVARRMAGDAAAEASADTNASETNVAEVPTWFPPAAAAIAGLSFMLMELVWYRMLAPLLGGTSYTFGLILAVALAGIGIGGALYSRVTQRATLVLFATTCALEALAIAIPYALGDRIATLALLLGPLAQISFLGAVSAWTLVTVVVVFPAAVVSGFQFPAIIGLYGRGARDVGSDVGKAYVANTAGAMVGSLAGGLGLLPLLSAPGCWRAVIIGLSAAALVSLAVDLRMRALHALPPSVTVGALAIAALATLGATGPTHFWRHSGIGAGRAINSSRMNQHDLQPFIRHWNWAIAWEADGVESAVALTRANGYAFIVNGKSDGHVHADRSTQVMSGLLATLLHEDPRRMLVVGLGTGSTAGWLGAIPSVERVDVVELEPAIVRVARDCAAVNQSVVTNPKVHITIGDAREALLTTRERYDVIFSEPSNPYRAGISSLFTSDFYRAVSGRLNDGGLFVQWMQTYDVQPFAVATAMMTLRSVFPAVSVWQTESGDILLIGEREARPLDMDRVRQRVSQEPVATALAATWGTTTAEGVLAHYVAAPALIDRVAEAGLGVVNTDDQNALEFAFARNLGRNNQIGHEVQRVAFLLGLGTPQIVGAYDRELVIEERLWNQATTNHPLDPLAPPSASVAATSDLIVRFMSSGHPQALARWRRLGRPPRTYMERLYVASTMADEGDDAFPGFVTAEVKPAIDRELLNGLWLVKKKRTDDAATVLGRAFTLARTEPWFPTDTMMRALNEAFAIGRESPELAKTLASSLSEPFAVSIFEALRVQVYLRLLRATGDFRHCVQGIDRWSPLPFERPIIDVRIACLEGAGDPRKAQAEEDLRELLMHTTAFGAAILPVPVKVPPAPGATPDTDQADAAVPPDAAAP